MKFLHAADLHIDSPLRGLSAYEGAPVAEMRGATRRAVENLVEAAISNKVEVVLSKNWNHRLNRLILKLCPSGRCLELKRVT